MRAFKDPAIKIQPVFSAEERHMRLIIDHAVFHLLMLRDIRRIGHDHVKSFFPVKSVQQIAAEAGYEDEKYFSRLYKKVTGLSPSEYRRKCRNGA